MNKIKIIVVNLIVLFTLVLFASGTVYAENDVSFEVEIETSKIDGKDYVDKLKLKIYKDGEPIETLKDFYKIEGVDYWTDFVNIYLTNDFMVSFEIDQELDNTIVIPNYEAGYIDSDGEYIDDGYIDNPCYFVNGNIIIDIAEEKISDDLNNIILSASEIPKVDLILTYSKGFTSREEIKSYNNIGIASTAINQDIVSQYIFHNSSNKISVSEMGDGVVKVDYNPNNEGAFKFSVTELGVYKINAFFDGEKNPFVLKYKYQSDAFGRIDDLYTQNVRLAAVEDGNNTVIISDSPSPLSYEIDVVLLPNKEYILFPWNWEFNCMESGIRNYEIYLSKEIYPNICYATNIPSSTVSTNWGQIGKRQEIEEMLNKSFDDLETTNFSNVQNDDVNLLVKNLETEWIVDWILKSPQDEDEDVNAKGSWLEGEIAKIIVDIGQMLLTIVEGILGVNNLSIDSIIFNDFEQTVIDLTPLGGIQFDSVASGGIFSQTNKAGENKIVSIVGILFNALRGLTIAIYIVMLLYIGVKILLSVGGKDQNKYVKYLEYWVTGLIILVILPYFLPAISTLNNELVGIMKEEALNVEGISPTEIINKAELDVEEKDMGTDHYIVTVKEEIEKRIKVLNAQIKNTPSKDKKQIQSEIDAEIDSTISNSWVISTKKEELKEKIKVAIKIIADNYLNWTSSDEQEYQAAVEDVRDWMFSNSYLDDKIIAARRELPNTFSMNVRIQLETLLIYIRYNATNWGEEQERIFNNILSNVIEFAKNEGASSNDYEKIEEILLALKNDIVVDAQDEEFQSIERLLSDYKDAMLSEGVEYLEKARDSLQDNIMDNLANLATEQRRVVYAVAWIILFYQMFAILFLYYKRVLVIIILIIIFPLVMAFYVFDKVGDGKSQSLENWLKEFITNITVQILHAAIYIVVVNVGIKACSDNPGQNWFFLIIAVCFLFPGERLLRTIIGLSSSTLGELKNNFGAAIMAARLVTQSPKLAARGWEALKGINNPNNKGFFEKMDENIAKEENAKQEKKNKKETYNTEKEKYRTKKQEEKRRSRDWRKAHGKEHLGDIISDGYGAIKKGAGAVAQKTVGAVSGVVGGAVGAVKNSKLGTAVGNVANTVKNSKVGKGVSSVAKGTAGAIKGFCTSDNKWAKRGRYMLKKAPGVALKGAMRGYALTRGAMEGLEKFSQTGDVFNAGLDAYTTTKSNWNSPFANKTSSDSTGNSNAQNTQSVETGAGESQNTGANANPTGGTPDVGDPSIVDPNEAISGSDSEAGATEEFATGSARVGDAPTVQNADGEPRIDNPNVSGVSDATTERISVSESTEERQQVQPQPIIQNGGQTNSEQPSGQQLNSGQPNSGQQNNEQQNNGSSNRDMTRTGTENPTEIK